MTARFVSLAELDVPNALCWRYDLLPAGELANCGWTISTDGAHNLRKGKILRLGAACGDCTAMLSKQPIPLDATCLIGRGNRAVVHWCDAKM